jgi:hypothetical protein
MTDEVQDLESMMSPKGFRVNIGGRWKYAYTKNQLEAALKSWADVFGEATFSVEAWLVKPINDGGLHKRSEFKPNVQAKLNQGSHVIGIAQDSTDKFNVASYAYAVCDTFLSRNGRIVKYKWTASPRKASQGWHEYVVANARETFEAINSSRFDESLLPEDLPYLYYQLEEFEQKGDIAYTALDIFDESKGKSWSKFIGWSKLKHLHEVISLDGSLCPSVIKLKGHVVYRQGDLCDDLDYLLSILRELDISKSYQVIAAMREPTESDIQQLKDKRFVFKGFDLLEDLTRTSALTNCGGFNLAFTENDLNNYGLVTDYSDAYRIKELLHLNYPNENHADCAVWAVWRMER